jgi:hypothetical protein
MPVAPRDFDGDVGSGSKAEGLIASTCCPLFPQRRTLFGEVGKTALCHERTSAPLYECPDTGAALLRHISCLGLRKQQRVRIIA